MTRRQNIVVQPPFLIELFSQRHNGCKGFFCCKATKIKTSESCLNFKLYVVLEENFLMHHVTKTYFFHVKIGIICIKFSRIFNRRKAQFNRSIMTLLFFEATYDFRCGLRCDWVTCCSSNKITVGRREVGQFPTCSDVDHTEITSNRSNHDSRSGKFGKFYLVNFSETLDAVIVNVSKSVAVNPSAHAARNLQQPLSRVPSACLMPHSLGGLYFLGVESLCQRQM